MKTSPQFLRKFRTGVFSLALPLGLWISPGQTQAADDFEYGRELMNRNSPDFITEDLVDRLITQLAAKETTAPDALLLKATFKRKIAKSSSLDKRKNLLEEADQLYKQFLEKYPKNRLFAQAEKDSESMWKDRLGTIRELVKTDPSQKRLLVEAANTVAKVAEGHKAEADKAEPAFRVAWKKMQAFTGAEGNSEKPLPPDLIRELDTAFGAWIVPDKRYLAAKVDQVDCYDDADGSKKQVAAEMIKFCETRLNDEAIQQFPIIEAYYNLMFGRIYSHIGQVDKATEKWQDALRAEVAEAQKKQMLGMKKLILFDIVKARMKMEKYDDAAQIIEDTKADRELSVLFEEDAGKMLLLDYAQAKTKSPHARQENFEEAVKTLSEALDKEVVKGANTYWAIQFFQAMGDALEIAKQRGVKPRLTSKIWYEAAHGTFLDGQNQFQLYNESKEDKKPEEEQKKLFTAASKQYDSAIYMFRKAITEARKPGNPVPERLKYEPKAWYEMGLAYSKMDDYYESIIAFHSLVKTFDAKNRDSWMKNLKLDPKTKKQADAILAEIDNPKRGVIPSGSKNFLAMLDNVSKMYKDIWNQSLKPRLMDQVSDPSNADKDYLVGKTEMEFAQSLAQAAKAEKNKQIAEDSYVQALEKYIKAGEAFSRVKPSKENASYEVGLYKAGTCFSLAQTLCNPSNFPSKKREDMIAKAKEMIEKALDAFKKYEDYTNSTPAVTDEDTTRRTQCLGGVLVGRMDMLLAKADYKNAITAADAYLQWEASNPPPKSIAYAAYLNKFRCYAELAVAEPPECDPFFAGMEEASKQIRSLRPNDKKLAVFMLNTMTIRTNRAIAKAEEKKMESPIIRGYEAKVVEYQSDRIALLGGEKDTESELTLDDYVRMLILFNKANQKQKAVDWGKKLLTEFDPDNKNVRIPDEDAVWQELLKNMSAVIKFDDINKLKNARNDVQVLVDYLYDTAAGINAPSPEKRPEFDKFNKDFAKAKAQMATIENTYKGIQVANPKATLSVNGIPESITNGKSYLDVIRDEISFRNRIEAVRDMMSGMSLEVAMDAQANNDTAGYEKYLAMAKEQIEILQKLRGETPSMQIKLAEIEITLGKYEDAQNRLYKARAELPEGSEFYFVASKDISRTYMYMKKYKDAAYYPEFAAITASFDNEYVQNQWPDMKKFLSQCYKNGVPINPQLKKYFSETGEPLPDEVKKAPAPAPATEKKEEPKKEAAATPEKKEEPKKEDVKKTE